MMVMTAKVDIRKVILILAAIAGIIIGLILLLRGGAEEEPAAATAAPAAVTDNDGRVQFLAELGWDVASAPTESSQVRIPSETTEIFDRYNALQKSQGYDLSRYAGKTVMRYVYQVNNYPGATDPVYATLLVHKNQVIGGDITNTSAKGAVQGLKAGNQAPPVITEPLPQEPTQ